MSLEIVGIHTEFRHRADVVTLKRPIVHTTAEPNGKGFNSEAYDTVLRSRRRLKLFGRVTLIPLPSRIEPLRHF